MKTFRVIIWDINRDEIEYYDVLPFFRSRYSELSRRRKSEVSASLSSVKEFVEVESACQFWSRCEYEVVVNGWPVGKNDVKIDVHDQIESNIDVIVDILFDEFNARKRRKNGSISTGR